MPTTVLTPIVATGLVAGVDRLVLVRSAHARLSTVVARRFRVAIRNGAIVEIAAVFPESS